MKLGSFKEWRKVGYRILEVCAFLTPIIWAPIYVYRKNYIEAYWCFLAALFMTICYLVERRANLWQKQAEYWEREAKQWRLFDAKVNALEPGQQLVITKGDDKAKDYRVM